MNRQWTSTYRVDGFFKVYEGTASKFYLFFQTKYQDVFYTEEPSSLLAVDSRIAGVFI